MSRFAVCLIVGIVLALVVHAIAPGFLMPSVLGAIGIFIFTKS